MSFREDLGSHQDVDFLRVNLPAHVLPRMLATSAVAVHAQNPRLGKSARKRGFDALRALPQRQQILIAAVRTSRRDSILMTAMVTLQPLAGRMQYELGRTALAVGSPIAASAYQDRRISA